MMAYLHHHSPSRLGRHDGMGSFVWLLLPCVALVPAAPVALVALLATGFLGIFLLHWRETGSLTQFRGGVAALVAGMSLLYLAGSGTFLQPTVALCLSGGLLAACLLYFKGAHPHPVSIRPYR